VRIALLCPDLSTNSLVRTYPIAKVLARRHEIQVLGFRSGDSIFEPYREEFQFESVRCRPLPIFLKQAWDLAGAVRADAVYAFKPLAASLWPALLARRRHRIPLFLDVEDLETAFYADVPRKDALIHLLHVERPNGFLWTWASQGLARACDEIFVVSRALQRRFGGTLLVHGADTAQFDPARLAQAEARRRLGLAPGRYVVFTGTPQPQKGLEELLEAIAALADPALRVLLVGAFRHHTAFRESLLRRHAERLILVEPRPHREMPLFLAAADVVALPQRRTRVTEAQVPGKVFEAMAMARPILATAVSDLPEILEGCGVVVEPGSAPALAQGLASLLREPERASALGEAARRRCSERYSWDAMQAVLDERLARWEAASAARAHAR
jgi:glycosyltransferase involved in cell wall biosynthesis